MSIKYIFIIKIFYILLNENLHLLGPTDIWKNNKTYSTKSCLFQTKVKHMMQTCCKIFITKTKKNRFTLRINE